VDERGRTIWIVDAHRGNGKRFVVRAEEKLDSVFGAGICSSGLRQIDLTGWRDFLQDLFKLRSESGIGRFSRKLRLAFRSESPGSTSGKKESPKYENKIS
jgi:hypothetical protein